MCLYINTNISIHSNARIALKDIHQEKRSGDGFNMRLPSLLSSLNTEGAMSLRIIYLQRIFSLMYHATRCSLNACMHSHVLVLILVCIGMHIDTHIVLQL